MRLASFNGLFIIGDSTVKNNTPGQMGWGTRLAAFFDTNRIKIENRALAGRSSRTFFTEGLWGKVLQEIQPGDHLLMQFGHNDGGGLNEPKGRASLKGNGDETREVEKDGKQEMVHTYGWYLRKYAHDAKEKGATPIVLSLIPRNVWQGEKVNRAAKDYGKWAREAAESEGALFVDLNEIVAKRYEAEGKEKVQQLYFDPADHTHTKAAGAQVNAQCVAAGVRELKGCALAGFLLPHEPPQ
ncbi:MAG TPA: rhamnogalacturonan acetylesterase [Candidatus Saccharimonadales bacterium]|nr:rhamnogalacturonan acetylesterase [Candidatus Saccharimonadales bacterium]